MAEYGDREGPARSSISTGLPTAAWTWRTVGRGCTRSEIPGSTFRWKHRGETGELLIELQRTSGSLAWGWRATYVPQKAYERVRTHGKPSNPFHRLTSGFPGRRW